MVTPSQLGSDYDRALDEIGFTVRFTEWGLTTGSFNNSDYDEVTLWSVSGTGHSGAAAIFPMKGGEEQYRKWGVLADADARVFVAGSLRVTGNTQMIFPNGSVYGVIEDGVRPYGVSGTTIFQECFVRVITAGSPYGRS